MTYYVYIMTNHRSTTLYIGATNNLERRVYEHKKKLVDGFTKKYNLDRLVYFEETMMSCLRLNARGSSRVGCAAGRRSSWRR